MKKQNDYLAEIKSSEEQIRKLKQHIQILKTKRKLQVLEDGGQLCSTCNGVIIFSYGNALSEAFSAQCEDCKQSSIRYPAGYSNKPVEEWPENK